MSFFVCIMGIHYTDCRYVYKLLANQSRRYREIFNMEKICASPKNVSLGRNFVIEQFAFFSPSF